MTINKKAISRTYFMNVHFGRYHNASIWASAKDDETVTLTNIFSDAGNFPKEMLAHLAKKRLMQEGFSIFKKIEFFESKDVEDFDETSEIWTENIDELKITLQVTEVIYSVMFCDNENVLSDIRYSYGNMMSADIKEINFDEKLTDEDRCDVMKQFYELVRNDGVRELSYSDVVDSASHVFREEYRSETAKFLTRPEIGFSYSGSSDPHWESCDVNYFSRNI